MEIFDQYIAAIKAQFPAPSPEMKAYIDGLGSIKTVAYDDIETVLDERKARWDALSKSERAEFWTIFDNTLSR